MVIHLEDGDKPAVFGKSLDSAVHVTLSLAAVENMWNKILTREESPSALNNCVRSSNACPFGSLGKD